MIINRKAKLTLIHTARRQLQLPENHYRALLEGAAGISSAAEIVTESQFDQIMEAFRALGFVSTAAQKAQAKLKGRSPTISEIKQEAQPSREDWWGCTYAQRAKIEALWALIAREKTLKALKHFAATVAKVDALNFLTPALASKVLVALSHMALKAGYDPKTGDLLRNKQGA